MKPTTKPMKDEGYQQKQKASNAGSIDLSLKL